MLEIKNKNKIAFFIVKLSCIFEQSGNYINFELVYEILKCQFQMSNVDIKVEPCMKRKNEKTQEIHIFE